MTNKAESYKSINYFKSLNTLRFIAAISVVIHHAESMKLKNGIGSLGSLSFLYNGHNAVTFFFVLSGFLITYLLLKERRQTKSINVKKFYLKRVLRILPLYYLLIIIGTILIPFLIDCFILDYKIPYSLNQVWIYFVLFMPGLVTFFYGHHLLEPLWSIGVEEMFYLIWAPLFRFMQKNVLILLLLVIAIKSILLLIPFLIETSSLYRNIVNTYCFEAMAVGGLGSYFVFNLKSDISKSLYKKYVQYLIYSILLIFLLFNSNIDNVVWRTVFSTPIISQLLIDFLFVYLIIGTSLAKNSILKLENKTFSYLGEISYGIYMYHTTIISLVILCFKRIPYSLSPILSHGLFYCLLIVGVLTVSHYSKKYFENYFLKFKQFKPELSILKH